MTVYRRICRTPGTVSGIQPLPNRSFTIEYQPGKTKAGSYKPPADVQGVFIDDAWVNVKFDGYDEENAEYLAAAIEVLPAGMVIDD